MNILISGYENKGRILSDLIQNEEIKKHNVFFTNDIHKYKFNQKIKFDLFIHIAWHTSDNYKNSKMNKKLYKSSKRILNYCKRHNIKSIYLGTSMDENCLYIKYKNKLDCFADCVIKIPYVWQTNRIGSLPYKVENNEDFLIYNDSLIQYVTNKDIIDKIICCINYNIYGKIWFNKPYKSISKWIEFYKEK